jgi:hypothetical protein
MWPSRTLPMDFHATLRKGQRQGAAEEQALIWLAESTGFELQRFQNSLLLTFSCSWVSVFNHTNGTFNSTAQPPQPATPAPIAVLTLIKDVQYSLAPDERMSSMNC